MAFRYVWDGTLKDDSDAFFNSSTHSHDDLQEALTAASAGDVILIAHDHDNGLGVAEANWVFTCGVASATNPMVVISVNRTTRVYQRGTTLQLDNSSGGYNIELDFWGTTEGVHIQPGNSFSSNANYIHHRLIDCELNMPSGTGLISIASNDRSSIEFRSCEINLNDRYISINYGVYHFIDCDFNGTFTSISTPFSFSSTGGTLFVEGGHLNNTSGGSRAFCNFSANNNHNNAHFHGIKTTGTWSLPGAAGPMQRATFHGVDGSGNHYAFDDVMGAGRVTESTSVYLNAGVEYGVVGSGTQLSHEMIPDTQCSETNTLKGLVVSKYFETAGTYTIRMQIAHNYPAGLTDHDFYLEALAHDTASDSGFARTTGELSLSDSSPTTHATSTEDWTGAGGLTLQYVDLSVTVQPGTYKIIPHLTNYTAGDSCHINPDIEAIAA